MEEDISRNVGAVLTKGGSPGLTDTDSDSDLVYQIYYIGSMTSRMIFSAKLAFISSINVSETKATVQDVPQANIFQSKERHSTVSLEELSERWQTGLEQAREKIYKTTQRLTCSYVIPLTRQYKANIVFHTKRITELWSTDTMDGWVKSLDGNGYS